MTPEETAYVDQLKAENASLQEVNAALKSGLGFVVRVRSTRHDGSTVLMNMKCKKCGHKSQGRFYWRKDHNG